MEKKGRELNGVGSLQVCKEHLNSERHNISFDRNEYFGLSESVAKRTLRIRKGKWRIDSKALEAKVKRRKKGML